MPASGKVLEDSIRLARVRRIKLTLYVVQVLMLVALGLLFTFVMGDAQITPTFYLPLDDFMAVMVLILLVICLEGFFFRIMEMRLGRSSSARHLMAKNSIKLAILVIIVSGIVTVVLMVPPILNALKDAGERTDSLTANTELTFWAQDPLALQHVSEIRVTAPYDVEVYLVSEDVYDSYNGALDDMYFLRLNDDDFVVTGDEETVIEVPQGGQMLYRLVLNDLDNPGTVATTVMTKEISGTFTGIVSLLALAFVVANIAWIAYLIPIERKYSAGSIYR